MFDWTGSVVPGEGLEPTRIAPADFKSAASATSAIPACAKASAYAEASVDKSAGKPAYPE
jgi:hypothetical protein